jgi:hypothetical protein
MSKLTKKQKILVEKVDPEKTYSVSEASRNNAICEVS